MRSGTYRLGAGLCAAALALGAAACGRSEEPDLAHGKDLFAGKGTCGTCHTLGRANTTGTRGPNLDEAFVSARQAGFGQTTVDGVVLRQIAHTRRNSIMPAGLVKGQDARYVAAYVAAVAGQPGKDKGRVASAGAGQVSSKPIAAKGGRLEIDANPTGALAFASTKAQAPAGSIEILSLNKATVDHDIALKDASGKEIGNGSEVSNGGTSKFSATLKPGSYTFLCTVPGHESGGMKGTLTVK